MDQGLISGVGDIEIGVVGSEGHGHRRGSTRGNGGLRGAQRARLIVNGIGEYLPVGAGVVALRSGNEDKVDGHQLASSEEGQDQTNCRDQKQLAQFVQLHAFPSSGASQSKPRKNSLKWPLPYSKRPHRTPPPAPESELLTVEYRLPCHCGELLRPRPAAHWPQTGKTAHREACRRWSST